MTAHNVESCNILGGHRPPLQLNSAFLIRFFRSLLKPLLQPDVLVVTVRPPIQRKILTG